MITRRAVKPELPPALSLPQPCLVPHLGLHHLRIGLPPILVNIGRGLLQHLHLHLHRHHHHHHRTVLPLCIGALHFLLRQH